MGSKKYHGMVAIETNSGAYFSDQQNDFIAEQPLQLPAVKKNYFSQRYNDELAFDYGHIPDFRYQLFWEPSVIIAEEQVSYEFYTSDIPGEYEIVLEGFTTYGKPISVRETITVLDESVKF
jgi:hypothetical protein